MRERLADAPAKEKPDLQAQIEEVERGGGRCCRNWKRSATWPSRGVMLELPLTGRRIPLIADEWAKPELGSGCVKITPAHDQNDYDVWQRHLEIGAVNILNPDGTLNESVPEKYRGLVVLKARDAVVADLEAAGLVVEIEDREIDLAHSDRSKTPIEPYAGGPVVRQDGRVGPIGHRRRERRPRENHPRPLRQGLPRLAQREARLAHRKAALVGTSDSGVDSRSARSRLCVAAWKSSQRSIQSLMTC